MTLTPILCPPLTSLSPRFDFAASNKQQPLEGRHSRLRRAGIESQASATWDSYYRTFRLWWIRGQDALGGFFGMDTAAGPNSAASQLGVAAANARILHVNKTLPGDPDHGDAEALADLAVTTSQTAYVTASKTAGSRVDQLARLHAHAGDVGRRDSRALEGGGMMVYSFVVEKRRG